MNSLICTVHLEAYEGSIDPFLAQEIADTVLVPVQQECVPFFGVLPGVYGDARYCVSVVPIHMPDVKTE